MSGFERILARVGGDALRDYCSSAIEDELKNLKTKMQSCLESVEKALEVQDAIQKLNVPLSETNVATFTAIQNEYQSFATDLNAFIEEQRQVQASQPPEPTTAARSRTDSVTSSAADSGGNMGAHQRLTKLASKIQQRLSKKHSSTSWIGKNLDDMHTVVQLLHSTTLEKPQRREIELALDHFVSAVLLSPAAQQADFLRLAGTLQDIEAGVPDLAEFARNSRTLVLGRVGHAQPGSNVSNGRTDPRSGDDHRAAKRPRNSEPDEFFVKVERQQQDHSAFVSGLDGNHEVRVSDLPWGVNQAEVESYFGIAGHILSVRMPTMDDGSTVGVAILRFSSPDGVTAALRMDGYQYQGKTIRVAVP